MYSYARVSEFWKFLDKYKEFNDLTDTNRMVGDLKEYQRLFALDAILSRLPHEGRILEVGGGVCHVLRSLHRRFEKKYDLWSVDPLDGSAGGPVGEESLMGCEKVIHLVRSKIGNGDPQLPDNYFDLVFSISVMEHIPLDSWRIIFDDIHRIARPGAIMFHSVDVPVDGPLAQLRLDGLATIPMNCGFVPIDPLLAFNGETIRKDPDVFYVSPLAYTRWLPYLPQGQNTLLTGRYQRISAIGALFTTQ
jgi:ubiquinone/menaquinone biosynthesis C-methylase UbiE